MGAEKKGSNESFNLNGNFNLMITCNERLHIRIEGDVDAWRRRLLIIPYEAEPPKIKIDNFAEKLMAEEGEGILNYAVEGAILYLKEIKEVGDFKLSKTQQKRIDDLLSESESVRHFLEERCVREDGEDITRNEVLEAYSDY